MVSLKKEEENRVKNKINTKSKDFEVLNFYSM